MRVPARKQAKLHRPGIEPGPPAWQASILPLNHRCDSVTPRSPSLSHIAVAVRRGRRKQLYEPPSVRDRGRYARMPRATDATGL